MKHKVSWIGNFSAAHAGVPGSSVALRRRGEVAVTAYGPVDSAEEARKLIEGADYWEWKKEDGGVIDRGRASQCP